MSFWIIGFYAGNYFLKNVSISSLEKTQTNLLKAAMGIKKFCRNTPILNALRVHRIERTLDIGHLELLKSMIKSNSRSSTFYFHLLNMYNYDSGSCRDNLVHRAHSACMKHNVSLAKYLIDENYASATLRKLKNCFPQNDGFTDSVRQLLLSNDLYDRSVLEMLISPF